MHALSYVVCPRACAGARAVHKPLLSALSSRVADQLRCFSPHRLCHVLTCLARAGHRCAIQAGPWFVLHVTYCILLYSRLYNTYTTCLASMVAGHRLQSIGRNQVCMTALRVCASHAHIVYLSAPQSFITFQQHFICHSACSADWSGCSPW